jgi:hypothetical protein
VNRIVRTLLTNETEQKGRPYVPFSIQAVVMETFKSCPVSEMSTAHIKIIASKVVSTCLSYSTELRIASFLEQYLRVIVKVPLQCSEDWS